MRKILSIVLLTCLMMPLFAHEQWLLTTAEFKQLSHGSIPLLFRELTYFNTLVISLITLIFIVWIIFNYIYPSLFPENINEKKLDWSLYFFRLWIGLILILSSHGLLPKNNVAHLNESTLFAPDLLISSLSPFWNFLQKGELWIGVFLLMGFFTRTVSILLFILVVLALYLFETPMVQYAGFYIGISLFLMINGGGEFSFSRSKIEWFPKSLLLLQCFTGLNLIYSALSIKLLHPNLTIAVLQKADSFTFGLPYPEFVFILLIVELLFGLLFLLGWHLRYVAIAFFILSLSLSLNLKEPIFSHSFIYAILFIFMMFGGYPVFLKR